MTTTDTNQRPARKTGKKTFLITGATAGIGRATALYLARQGHEVLATGRRQGALDSLNKEAAGLALQAFALDVNDAGSIEAAVKRAEDWTAGRGIDVLVNNAGYGLAAPVLEATDADLRAQFDTNVFGLLAVTRAFAPQIRSNKGRIINISSIGGRMTTPMMGVYHASKYALEALSDAMRRELAVFGVKVILVEPGAIQTEFGDTMMGIFDRYRARGSEYGPVFDRYENMTRTVFKFAPGPEVIAKAINRAATARWPRARYVAPGREVFLLAFMNWMPTRLVDAIVRTVIGLTSRNLTPSRHRPRITASA